MTGGELLSQVTRLPRYGLMGLIRLYQMTISPLLGPVCKYYPSCSHYGYEAVHTHGAAKGSLLAAWRVLRCNPFSHGGVDEVPPPGTPLFVRRQTGADAPT